MTCRNYCLSHQGLFPLPADLLSAFASAFNQNTHLLKLSFSPSSGIAEETLLPWQLSGDEAINQGLRYELVCLSADAHLAASLFMGQPVQISLLTDSGDYRPVGGYVTEVQVGGGDSGLERYTLIVEDLFAVLTRRTNNRIQQEISSKDAVLNIIFDHRARNAVLGDSLDIDDRTALDYPTQALISQLNESDADLCKRKLADEGINYYFSGSSSIAL